MSVGVKTVTAKVRQNGGLRMDVVIFLISLLLSPLIWVALVGLLAMTLKEKMHIGLLCAAIAIVSFIVLTILFAMSCGWHGVRWLR